MNIPFVPFARRMNKDRVILGIDPGTNILGYGIIHVNGNNLKVLDMGVLRMDKIDDHAIKLKMIFEKVLHLIDTFHPDDVAAEAPFFGKNVQSMLKLGRAQGVALAAALYRNIPICEYSPRKIKQSITGKGAASKEQVSAMIQRILKIKMEDMPHYLDVTDGLAAAVCHYYQTLRILNPSANSTMKVTKKSNSWSAFVKNNPERIKVSKAE